MLRGSPSAALQSTAMRGSGAIPDSWPVLNPSALTPATARNILLGLRRFKPRRGASLVP